MYHTQHFIKTEFLKVLNYALDTMCWDKHNTFETNNLTVLGRDHSSEIFDKNYLLTELKSENSVQMHGKADVTFEKLLLQ